MQVLAVDEGEHCTLSPNKSLYAIVKKGIKVVFMDYVSRTNQLNNCIATGLAPTVALGNRQPGEAVISCYTALDEVCGLQWSPDSSLVALLLTKRGIIEIVSVYGKCRVAQIDAGVTGLRAVAWHPSSRAVYWGGFVHTYVASLADSQVMCLPGGVKYSLQLAARCVFEASAAPCLKWPVSSSAVPNGNDKKSETKKEKTPRSSGLFTGDALLIRFSVCRRFLMYVAPKSLRSPLYADCEGAGNSPQSEGPASSQRGLEEASNNDLEPSHHRSEWIVVLSATTHEALHVFPAKSLIKRITDMIPVQGGIVLVDHVHGSLVLVTFDGARVLHREESGVRSVVASTKGDVLLVVFDKSCRAVITTTRNVLALRHIRFADDVILRVRLGELAVLEEPSTVESGSVEFLLSRELNKRDERTLSHFEKYYGWPDGLPPSVAPLVSPVAISTSGKMAAVSLSMWPSTVLVVDIVRQCVLTVVCHREVVTSLCWGPSPCSEYWKRKELHTSREIGETNMKRQVQVPGDGDGEDVDDSRSGTGDCSRHVLPTGCEEPLLVTTDNHESKVFVCLADRAVCFLVTGQAWEDGLEKTFVGRCGSGAVRALSGTNFPKFRVSRGMFGDASADLVLADDLRGIAITATFHQSTECST
ncbi:hypothetical protein ERJ75_000999400 [Trypanosoma vivax]|uniref:Uncharacterized protein n=1 Tax=Trypanosoma vivax (strain Y486) TaxID=1055687 RepID=F9WPK6_TRYVY|nr:hypothetical protein ERJ75_000999400 [Trypanosoma vivax]CCD19483.1 hypothetical protein TvY486_0021810 [Trypanosoma vivax Y486]|eukprot:CCD19483.1 hypothetical protein TvY486_0021810 [Trypanosoma vivax Y486]